MNDETKFSSTFLTFINLIKKITATLLFIILSFSFIPSYALNFPSQTNVPIDKEWTIEFNTNLDPDSVSSNTFYIRDWDYDLVECSVNLKNDNSVTIRPLHKYEYGKDYTLYISSDVKSESNTHLEEKGIMPFTTIKNTD